MSAVQRAIVYLVREREKEIIIRKRNRMIKRGKETLSAVQRAIVHLFRVNKNNKGKGKKKHKDKRSIKQP